MNLLLYAESRNSLARQRGEIPPNGSSRLWNGDLTAGLPDTLFEELGYFGALDDQDELDEDEHLSELFRRFAEPELSFRAR